VGFTRGQTVPQKTSGFAGGVALPACGEFGHVSLPFPLPGNTYAARMWPESAVPRLRQMDAIVTDANNRAGPAAEASPGRYLTWISLLLVSAIAFAVRTLNWTRIFIDGQVRFLGNDTLYHMRRIFIALSGTLAVPAYDSYMNYPHGFHCNWPPLFDQVVAGIAFIAGRGDPSSHLVETVAALVPPAAASLTVVVVYLVARSFLNRAFALLAAVFLCFLPYHIQVSVLGRPDHHVAVVLLSSILLLSMLRLARAKSTFAILACSAIAGIILAASIATWLGSLMFAVILLVSYGTLMLVNSSNTPRLNHLTAAACLTFLVSGACLAPVALRTHWGRSGLMAWEALSGFQVVLLAVCAAAALGLRLLVGAQRSRKDGNVKLVLVNAVAFLVLAGGAVVLLARTGFIDVLLGSPEWVFKQDPMMKHVFESGRLTLRGALKNFTGLVVAFPFLVGALCYCRRESRFEEIAVFSAWSAFTGLSCIVQERFSDLFSVTAAVLAAFVAAVLFEQPRLCGASVWERARRRLEIPRTSGWIVRATAIIIMCLAFWPTATWLSRYRENAPRFTREPLYDLCSWLRENTPVTSGYADISEKPEYSVLADRTLGNALAYLARRPNVANNFVGWEENRQANLAPYRFFVTDDVNEARGILDEYGVRYVVVSEYIESGLFARMLAILDLDHGDYFERGSGPGTAYALSPKTRQSMAVRMYINNAAGIDSLKLVYESPHTRNVAGGMMAVYKVFAYTRMSNDEIPKSE